MTLAPGERLVLCSDGVFAAAPGQAGLGHEGVAGAALRSERGSAADTVRQIHRAVLAASGDDLRDDATVVCLGAE
jgi:serine phosphatase RsbU (regulator of sigma subunit)